MVGVRVRIRVSEASKTVELMQLLLGRQFEGQFMWNASSPSIEEDNNILENIFLGMLTKE